MSVFPRLRLAMVSADRGIAPGTTKGAALHLRGLVRGFGSLGHGVTLYSHRTQEGPFPCPVQPMAEVTSAAPPAADVIYERYSLGHLDGLRAARAAGVPFVLEVNAPLVEEATTFRPGTVSAGDRRAEQQLLAEADLVVTVSSALSDWARRLRAGPVVTVANGFEPAWFEPAASVGQAAAKPRWDLVFCGHPKPWHGADRLVPLVAELAGRGHRASLLVVGGGEGADDVRRAAVASGVADLVEVTGPVAPQEAARLIASARVGLAPYPRIEPFYFCPLKIVDYLAAGLAVVATDQGDIRQLTAGHAVLVDPSEHVPVDAGSLADAVVGLLVSEAERRGLGAQGRRHAWGALTWADTAAATLAAIAPLVDPDRRAAATLAAIAPLVDPDRTAAAR